MILKQIALKVKQFFNCRKKSKKEDDREETLGDKLVHLCPILTNEEYALLAGKGGWDDALESFYKKVEALNILYQKFRVKANIVEMKEKYGTLRLEAKAMVDLPYSIKCICKIFEKIHNFITANVNFKKLNIIDVPFYVEHVEKEILKSDYLKSKQRMQCSNQKYFERDGKYYEVTDYEHYEQNHLEPSRFKILYKINDWLYRNCHSWSWEINPSRQQLLIMNLMQHQIDHFIKETKEKTWHSCEECGNYIDDSGDKWNQRCQTLGWVSYLCHECAKKTKGEYYKNGDLWRGDNIIKTKEQLQKEEEEEEKQYKELKEKNRPTEEALEKEIQKALEEEKSLNMSKEI